jgi:hypothetical protein
VVVNVGRGFSHFTGTKRLTGRLRGDCSIPHAPPWLQSAYDEATFFPRRLPAPPSSAPSHFDRRGLFFHLGLGLRAGLLFSIEIIFGQSSFKGNVGGDFWEKLGRFTRPTYMIGAGPLGGRPGVFLVSVGVLLRCHYWVDVVENRQHPAQVADLGRSPSQASTSRRSHRFCRSPSSSALGKPTLFLFTSRHTARRFFKRSSAIRSRVVNSCNGSAALLSDWLLLVVVFMLAFCLVFA